MQYAQFIEQFATLRPAHEVTHPTHKTVVCVPRAHPHVRRARLYSANPKKSQNDHANTPQSWDKGHPKKQLFQH